MHTPYQESRICLVLPSPRAADCCAVFTMHNKRAECGATSGLLRPSCVYASLDGRSALLAGALLYVYHHMNRRKRLFQKISAHHLANSTTGSLKLEPVRKDVERSSSPKQVTQHEHDAPRCLATRLLKLQKLLSSTVFNVAIEAKPMVYIYIYVGSLHSTDSQRLQVPNIQGLWSQHLLRVWFGELKSLNVRYLDPLGLLIIPFAHWHRPQEMC